MYLRSMMCAVIRLLHLGGVAIKVTAHTPARITLAKAQLTNSTATRFGMIPFSNPSVRSLWTASRPLSV
jgi:hypothetical protein